MTRRRPRSLRPDEAALWAHVAKSVAPLPGRKAPEPDVPPDPPAPVAIPDRISQAPVLPAPPTKKAASPPLAPLDRRERTALKRGSQSIDGVLDLHGLRQDEAHGALRRFLSSRHAQGARIVLVITGKGGAGRTEGHESERGVLKRVVPHWLRLPDVRPYVLGFEEAGPRHGGAGALYVRLRRRREPLA